MPFPIQNLQMRGMGFGPYSKERQAKNKKPFWPIDVILWETGSNRCYQCLSFRAAILADICPAKYRVCHCCCCSMRDYMFHEEAASIQGRWESHSEAFIVTKLSQHLTIQVHWHSTWLTLQWLVNEAGVLLKRHPVVILVGCQLSGNHGMSRKN